jgi:hypothetical protein
MSESLAKRYGIGCGDSSCAWGSRGGMATNGGCRCLERETPSVEAREQRLAIRQGIHRLRELVDHPKVALALDELVRLAREAKP